MSSTEHPEPRAAKKTGARGRPSSSRTTREKPRAATDLMGGFGKGLAVLEAFDAERASLTIAEVGRSTGLDRASVRRCLLTLVERGYATVVDRKFSLTVRILRLGYGYLSATPLPGLVQPHLERLAATIHESCSVSVLDGGEIVYVARASEQRVMSVSLTVGSRLPAYCASMGRVLLAALPDAESRGILASAKRTRLTPHTRVTMADLMRELEIVRERGFAIVDQELEVGLRSIAVPLRGRSDRVVAALNVGAQAGRVSLRQLREAVLPRLLEVADALAPQLA